MIRVLAFCLLVWISTAGASTLHILCYHDVRAKASELPDQYGITTEQLASHFAWLRHAGYTVVTLDQVLAAQRGDAALPERAVMLTFDDGLASVATEVLPLLNTFNYPALVAVVGKWVSDEAQWPLRYGRVQFERKDFLSTQQLRTLAASPLIEFASHSYDLHKGLLANTEGQEQPAAVVRIFDPRVSRRESDQAYLDRIREDLTRSVERIVAETGKRPRAIVWPFGEFTGSGAGVAKSLGMTVGMTLTEGSNSIPGPLGSLKRVLVSKGTDIARLATAFAPRAQEIVRFLTVPLDTMALGPTERREAFLARLLDRVADLGATHVLLPAFTDETKLRALFQTDRVAIANDVLNRVAWQLRTRVGVKAYARWPVAALDRAGVSPQVQAQALEDLIDTTPLAGVVFDYGATLPDQARIESLAEIVRSAHPDAGLVWAASDVLAPELSLVHASLSPELRPSAWLLRSQELTFQPSQLAALRSATTPFVGDHGLWLELPYATTQGAGALAKSMLTLQRNGWLQFGWSPDDVSAAQPAVATVRNAFSRRAELR